MTSPHFPGKGESDHSDADTGVNSGAPKPHFGQKYPSSPEGSLYTPAGSDPRDPDVSAYPIAGEAAAAGVDDLAAAPRRPVAFATYSLIAVCTVMFIVQSARPETTLYLSYGPISGLGEPYRFFSAAFLHGSWLHLFMNMLALWSVGRDLEILVGSARFLLAYLGSALAGSFALLAWVFLSPEGLESAAMVSTVGASGAVFGIFGVVFALLRRLRLGARSLAVLIVLNLVIGFVVPGIAWQAHVGGLAFGLAVGGIYGSLLPRGKRALSLIAAGVLVVALVAAAFALNQLFLKQLLALING